MNENKRTLLKMLFEELGSNINNWETDITYNYNQIELKLQSFLDDFKDDITIKSDVEELQAMIANIYFNKINKIINRFSYDTYNKSIDFVLMNYNEENILLNLEHYLKENGIPNELRCDIFDRLKQLSNTLNKRFSFDEISLVHLIEASIGKNIITEEGSKRINDDKVLHQSSDGYEYMASSDKKVFTTTNKEITDLKSKEDIRLESFPMGNIISIDSTNNIMNKLLKVLFENINLCFETYNSIYTSGDNIVTNEAKLLDGTTFPFIYYINEYNIPHLLGIPNPKRGNVSQKQLDILNNFKDVNEKALSTASNALDLLLFIFKHQDKIIELGGIYEENGKKYELLNWEKIILKTSSFMRGDFFKTCFCLVKLAPDKYLVDRNNKGGYVSISSTEYDKELSTSKSSGNILNDLLKMRKKKRDFIFRGFKMDPSGNQRVNSIATAKSETIRVGSNNELLKTLERYREMLETGTGSEMGQEGIKGGSSSKAFPENKEYISHIVEEIENENYIRKFSTQEQLELALSLEKDLSLKTDLSKNREIILGGDSPTFEEKSSLDNSRKK